MRTRIINFIPTDGLRADVTIYDVPAGRRRTYKRSHRASLRSAFRLIGLVNRWMNDQPGAVTVKVHFHGWNASIYTEV